VQPSFFEQADNKQRGLFAVSVNAAYTRLHMTFDSVAHKSKTGYHFTV